MSCNFYMKDYCEVLQPDGRWYRGTIQGGPYDSGGIYYKVHIHHPVNKHEMIWATLLRLERGNGFLCQPSIAPTITPSVSVHFGGPPANTLSTPVTTQFFAFNNQFSSQAYGVSGILTPSGTSEQFVVPAKRPLDTIHQPGTAAETVAEPAAKYPAQQRANDSMIARVSDYSSGAASPSHERPFLVLLEGPVIEVHVKYTSSHGSPEKERSWGLSKALLAHFSPFFKPTTESIVDTNSRTSIDLPGFNPTAFAMFVEWMYWGSCNAPGDLLSAYNLTDIDAWILGDKLEVAKFQNLAMVRLYSQHTGPASHQLLTIDVITYVCVNTTTGSPLRLFHLDVLAQNFTDHARVKGTLEEWDVALQKYPDARLLLLGSFWTSRSRDSFVGAKEDYLIKFNHTGSSRATRSKIQLGSTDNGEDLRRNSRMAPQIKAEVKEELEF